MGQRVEVTRAGRAVELELGPGVGGRVRVQAGVEGVGVHPHLLAGRTLLQEAGHRLGLGAVEGGQRGAERRDGVRPRGGGGFEGEIPAGLPYWAKLRARGEQQ